MKIEAASRLQATQVLAAPKPSAASIDKALKQARAKVSALKFGTPAWEVAMAEVRKLVDLKNAATDFGKHTSRDGDVIGM